MNLRVLGVCGGNGVILHPFLDHLIANIEPRAIFHTPGQIQWQLNFPDIPMRKELQPYKDIDIIIGAPDCGHSSILSYSRAKKLSDPKENKSFQLFVESIKKYQPKAFLMENLPKLLDNVDLSEIFPEYNIQRRVDSVSAWGNSQKSRVRLIVVGIRSDLNDRVKWPKGPEVFARVDDLLKGLGPKEKPELCHVRESDDSYVPLYTLEARRIQVKEARKIWQTSFKNSRRWKVPHTRMVNQPGVYRLLEGDLPLTVRKQSRQFDPQGFMLTPRDIARIQGVPDSFKLWYEPDRHLYCINKARATCAKTPPYEIGVWFKRQLNKIKL